MSSLWHDTLQEAWTELGQHPPQARQFRTRRLSYELALDAYAALRSVDDAPCLLIDAEAQPDSLFEVGGMRLGVTANEQGPMMVLSLEDGTRIDLFTTLCGDAISASTFAELGNELAYFLARLDAWRRFLRERRSRLSREETIGLIGELLILERLVSINPAAQNSWKAPDDGLHDFVQNGHAVEVKASLGPASAIRISSLDQLETTGLRRLDLLHVRLIEAPDGRSMEGLIANIAVLLPDEMARRSFENALLRRGLMPDDMASRSQPLFQLREISGYTIDDLFPRLTRSAVPPAVTDASYALDLRTISGLSADSADILDLFCRQDSA
ncbi:MAG: PD-(D/E)XK motif protein [Alphaproteobacteria bacterium]|nr:PD-(D/E)XK motif protein [Alphaproteobacteria bacterium]